jgi:hypothetical protein
VKHTLRHVAAIASHLASRDDRDTPLFAEAGHRKINTIYEKTKEKFSCKRAGADHQTENAGKLRVSAQIFLFIRPAGYDAARRDLPVKTVRRDEWLAY